MRFSIESRGRLLVAECSPDLQEQAATLLKLAAETDARGEGLGPGMVIEFGWAPLKLFAEVDDLVFSEPDYTGEVNETVPSVDHTLRVLAGQTRLLNSLGVEGVAARYDQGIVLKRGALQLPRVYLLRRIPVSIDDSGWYIAPADDLAPPDQGDLDAVHVYELLGVRPALLSVMALPVDYLVIFDGDKIESAFDNRGAQLLAIFTYTGPKSTQSR
jgi:hypothetical protein